MEPRWSQDGGCVHQSRSLDGLESHGKRVEVSVGPGLTCAVEGAAGVVAASGLRGHLPGDAVDVQVSGDPAGLNGHQVTPDT